VIAAFVLAALAQAAPTVSPSPTVIPPSASPTPQPSPSPTATPARKLLFVAPKGWVMLAPSRPSKGWKILGRWSLTTQKVSHSFNVLEGPNAGHGAADVATRHLKTLKHDDPKMRLTLNRAETLCNGERGWSISFASRGMWYTQTIGVTRTHTYIATYGHSANVANDREGIAAVKSLCPSAETGAPELERAPIAPPPGWKQGDQMWSWFAPNNQTQTLTVLIIPTSTTSNEQVRKSVRDAVSGFAANIQMVAMHQVNLCHGQGFAARFYAIVKDKPVEINAVAAPAVPSTYTALYIRPLAAPSMPAAQKALLSLCPAGR
jgi:hypothetical protein